MVEQIKEFLYFFIHIVIQILRINEAGQPADSHNTVWPHRTVNPAKGRIWRTVYLLILHCL